VYPTIASTDFDLTGVVFTKVDERTFTLVANNSTATRYVLFVTASNGIRTGKHRIAFDLTLNSGSIGTITGFYTDFDGDPSNGGSYGSYSLTEGSNVIDFEIFDDGVGASPEIIWAINTGSTFDISVTNLKVTHEPDTVTVDRTAVPKEQSKETTFGGSKSITIKREIEPLLSEVVGGASAAYSLRDLNDKAGNNKVVRVRRSSDNAEKDFTAKEVSNGTLKNWTNAQVTPPLDLRELTATGRDGPIIEAAAAYSLRNLSDSYTGNVVDVRRSSDDAEDSFTAAEVADGTMVAWVGAGNDGFVSQWYDQSTTAGTPNANHAVQTDAASQPKIVDAGTLLNEIKFDGVDDGFSIDFGADLTQANSLFLVHQSDTLTDASNEFFDSAGLAAPRTLFDQSGTDYRILSSNSVNTGVTLTTDKSLVSVLYNGASSLFAKNGTATGALNAGSVAINQNSTLGFSDFRFYDGTMAECIIYNSDQSDNRTALEANIGEVYGIAGIPAYDDTVNGFVETWYDQSGNGNDVTQQVSGSQPKIVDAGVLVSGGLDFDGVDDGLATSGQVLTSSSFYAASVMQHATGTSIPAGQNIFGQYQVNTPGRFQLSANNLNQYSFFANAADSISGFAVGAFGTSRTLISVNGDGSNAEIWRDGTSKATDTYSGFTPANVNFTIGIDASGDREFNGKIAEVIIYPSDQSDNHAAIETNINNQYNIY
jgi:hypothetical protein